MKLRIVVLLFLLLVTKVAAAEKLRVAVASNFSATMKLLVKEFSAKSNHQLSISSASTGKLFAQIVNGAPYDLFFSADEKRIDLLKKQGLTYKTVVYAKGQLIFVAKDIKPAACRSAINHQSIKRLAIANPKTAPYGLAVQQALIRLGKWDQLQKKLIMGENILQAYQYVATGSADAGFIAASIVHRSVELEGFCRWRVPENLHSPVLQKMAWLKRSSKNIAASEFFDYIKSDEAGAIIKANGYYLK